MKALLKKSIALCLVIIVLLSLSVAQADIILPSTNGGAPTVIPTPPSKLDFSAAGDRAAELEKLYNIMLERFSAGDTAFLSVVEWYFDADAKKIAVGINRMDDAKIARFLSEIGGTPDDYRFFEMEEIVLKSSPAEEAPAYSRITLNSRSVRLTVRQLHYVSLKSSKPAGAAENQMTYTSSNPKVAAVEESNVVRAIAPGSATITVKAKNGKAKATLRVRVSGFNKKLRFYDAEKDAEGVTQKAPSVDVSALDLDPQNPNRLSEQALLNKYGKDATTLSLPEVTVESAGGQLYYALLYTMLTRGEGRRGRGYVVIPSQFPGCSEANMAALRNWLRESFDGIVIGMSEDYGEDASFPYSDLYKFGGTRLVIYNVVPVSATCFIADISQHYGELGANGYRVMLEQTQDGWRIDYFEMTWIS